MSILAGSNLKNAESMFAVLLALFAAQKRHSKMHVSLYVPNHIYHQQLLDLLFLKSSVYFCLK
jgi:hypothetical protein